MPSIVLPTVSRRAFVQATVHTMVEVAAARVLGCSSEVVQSTCLYDETPPTPRELNPDGKVYPSGPYGSQVDQVFPNLAFSAMPKPDRASLTPISLIDYYDPDRQHHKLLHLMVIAMWCPVCAQETSMMPAVYDEYYERGLRVMQIAVNGFERRTSANLCDAQKWIEKYGLAFPLCLDPGAETLAQIIKIVGVPWNVTIDTSTMRITSRMFAAPVDYKKYIEALLQAAELDK